MSQLKLGVLKELPALGIFLAAMFLFVGALREQAQIFVGHLDARDVEVRQLHEQNKVMAEQFTHVISENSRVIGENSVVLREAVELLREHNERVNAAGQGVIAATPTKGHITPTVGP